MNLFFVTTPLQYICAKEAKMYYQTLGNILVVKVSNNESERVGSQQLIDLIDDSDWDEVIYIRRSLTIPFVINKIRKNYPVVDGFFVSDYVGWYASVFLKNLSFNRYIYIDDGVMTVFQYNSHIKNQLMEVKEKKLYNLWLRVNGLKSIKFVGGHGNVEIFTMFDIDSNIHTVNRNRLSILRRMMSHNIYDGSAPVAFIGDGGVSDATIPESEYMDALNELSANNKGIVYFPHRTESASLTEKVLSVNNLSYYTPSSPIEMEVIKKSLKFSKVLGFGSTALYTLSILDEALPVEFIKINAENYYTKRLAELKLHFERQFNSDAN